jgi:phage head maturation protease
MTQIAPKGPKGWRSDKVEHRFAGGTPSSYNEAEHTAECVISAGAEVTRMYGKEVLEISRAAIDLSRIPCPLLDSHNQTSIDNVLGVIESAWISNGKLYGKIRFAQTPRGKLAEGMVKRGEVTGISAGYRVTTWLIKDLDGDIVDESNASWSDELTFTATRWTLYEGSLVGVPADILSAVRKVGGDPDADSVADVRARMESRERMATRSRMHARASDLETYDKGEPADIVAEILANMTAKQKKMEEDSLLLDAEIEIADQPLN